MFETEEEKDAFRHIDQIQSMKKQRRIKWPHRVDHENKEVFVYVASGWPTVMMVPQVVESTYPGYTAKLVSKDPNE